MSNNNTQENIQNKMKLEFSNRSENESFARIAVSAFVAPLDPTMEELTEIKTAISEAVSNSIIHAYKEKEHGLILIECMWDDYGRVVMTVSDQGVGIANIAQAREPLFTTKSNEERSGMGFTVMESFMDKLDVESKPNEGTKVTMIKNLDRAYGF